MYLVTVKLDRNPDHDPHNKVTGWCPVQQDRICTDVTGQHHTVLVEGPSLEWVRTQYEETYHVTRIEQG